MTGAIAPIAPAVTRGQLVERLLLIEEWCKESIAEFKAGITTHRPDDAYEVLSIIRGEPND